MICGRCGGLLKLDVWIIVEIINLQEKIFDFLFPKLIKIQRRFPYLLEEVTFISPVCEYV